MNPPTEQAGARPRALIVSALGVAQILAWGSSYYLPAVLAKPIADDTGWSLAWIMGGVCLGLFVAGLIAPRVGRTIERQGGRSVLAASALLLSAGLALLGAATSLAIHAAAWLVMGLGMGCGLYDATFSTLGRLYGRDARSAITVLTLWGGFASTVCWPLSALLVETVGWRGACFTYAALHLAVVLPLYLFALPAIPPAMLPSAPQHPANPALQSESLQRSRSLLLGLLMVILTLGGVISSIWSVHLLTILQAGGVALAAAVALGALVGPAQVGARVVEMMIGRYHHPIWTLVASVTLIALGLIILTLGMPLLALPLILYGAGNGIWSIARGTLPLALFGPVGYAALMGRLAMPSLIAQAAAPMLGAVLLEQVGAAATLTVLSGLAIGCLALTVIFLEIARRTGAAA